MAGGYFPEFSDKSVETTVQSDALGIEQGDRLSVALEKIVKELECLKAEACDPCNKCKDISGNGSSTAAASEAVGVITTAGPSRVKRVPAPFKLSVNPKATNVGISYDLKDAIACCEFDNYNTNVNVESENVSVFRGKTTSGATSLRPDQFPATLDIQVTGNKKGKQEILSFSKVVSATRSDTDEFLLSRLAGETNVETQKDVNEHFDSQIADIQTKIDALNNVSVDEKTGVESIVSDLDVRVKDLDDKTNDAQQIKVMSPASGEKDLQGYVEELESTVSSLQNQNSVLANEVARLDAQYQSLADLLL